MLILFKRLKMFKTALKVIVPIVSLTYCFAAHASFVLSGTRVIYDDQQKNVAFQVTNGNNETYGAQVWIGNGNHPANKVYFIPMPAVFVLKPGQTQVVRLINTDKQLPNNRESLFWLNVQQIPQMEKNSNSLQIAMDTRVKLLYRPESIQEDRPEAEEKTQIEDVNGKVSLKNPTPYYFAVVNVQNNGKSIVLTPKQAKELTVFKPFSSINLDLNFNQVNNFNITAINDYGIAQTYQLKKA